MDLAAFFDAVFLVGATASAAFIVYGGWLCRYQDVTAPANETTHRGSRIAVQIDPRSSELSSTVALPLLAFMLTLAGISSSLA